jgi:hypothetical protein
MPVLKDFRIKNGLIVGSDNAGTITAGVGNYSTSLSSFALSGIDGGFTGSSAIRVPTGTTAQRPTGLEDGLIRLNTTLSQFEGYSSSNWRGLGGVIDVDQDTKILAELTSGSNENSLFFYTSGGERLRITNSGLVSAAGDVTVGGDLTVQGTHTTLNTSVTSTTTATENNFVITSTDSGAAASPDLKLWRNSTTPADSDIIGNVIFTGNDSGGTATDYGHIFTQITDVTNATEDSRMVFKTISSGSLADRFALTETGTLSASGQIIGNITGDLTGNADTATALETARNIGGVSFDGTAAIVPTTIVVADTTSTNAYVGLFESATGDLLPKTDANIFYNASGSGKLTVTGAISAGGTIYADAFTSVTGGSTIDFQDPVAVTGTLTLTDDIVHSGDTDTKLSFTTDTITLYGANSNLLRIDGSGNVVGIGTVSTASPSIPTVVEFNNNTTAYKSASATITTGASAALLSIPTASYRSGKIVLQSVAASGGHMDVTELLYIHNGTTVYTTEYGTVRVGDAIGTYTGEIVGSNVEIRAVNGVGVTAEFVGSVTMLSV